MPIRLSPGDLDPAMQFVWVDGLVMAWNPESPFRESRSAPHRSAPHRTDGRTVMLHLPGRDVAVECRPVDLVALDALAEHVPIDAGVQPSVAWFAAVHEYARRLVAAGRVMPVLEPVLDLPPQRDGATWWRASWRALAVDQHAAEHSLLAAVPPAAQCAAAIPPVEVLRTMVDRCARSSLAAAGWHTSIADYRSSAARALRLVGRSLSGEQALFSVPPELDETVGSLADDLADMTRRANGEPVVRLRLRLSTPAESDAERRVIDLPFDDGPTGAWPLDAEVVDLDDRSRWCEYGDLSSQRPAAIDVARGAHHLPAVLEQLATTLRIVSSEVPALGEWAESVRDGSDAPLAVDIDTASALLEAVDVLARNGVELLAPERLVRATASTRGTAQPAAAVGHGTATSGRQRFGARALVEWRVVVDDTPVSEEALRRAAEGGASLIEAGGRWVQVDRADAERALRRLDEHRLLHGELSPIELLELAAELAAARALDRRGADRARPAQRAADEIDTTDANLTGDAELNGTGWAADLLAGLPDATARDGVVPTGFVATLRPYQVRGLGWLQGLRELALGGCLADDMGLGKTPTTLAHLAGLEGPHLVVCPLSVVHNWETEAARFTPDLRVLVHHGAGRATGDEFREGAQQHDLVVTTYQMATRDVEVLRSVEWSTLVLDEAQMVKNPDTDTARALRTVGAAQVVALTGTPVENRLRELWSIFNIVVPGLLGNATAFRERFAAPIERNRDPGATAALRQLVGPFLLRRTKADRTLVPDLPDKVEQVAWAALTAEQAAMYKAVVDRLLAEVAGATGMKRRGLVLAAITRLKQICNHPAHALADGSRLAGRSGKLHRFDELVADLLDADEQALVFTQFKEMGMLLQQHLLERHRLSVPFLHGGLRKPARDRMVADFHAGAGAPRLMVVSLRAGGTGLNLVAASRVVHYDRWWNPAVEDQATDRAWRIGQQRSVFVHKLVCEGTVEERIDALIAEKRALADAVVGESGEQWLSELDDDELRSLVALDHGRARA